MKNLAYNFAIIFLSFSFYLHSEEPWEKYKDNTCAEMEKISGWCTEEKARLMMDLIKNERLKDCIEIGVFSGKSLYPIMRALQYNAMGKVFGIDAWDPFESIKGFEEGDLNYIWWKNLDYTFFYNETKRIISDNHLSKYCVLIKNRSSDVSFLFQNNSIDFIHIDGNHNEEFSFQDVQTYFPKLKDGGYLLLTDPIWSSLNRSLIYLLERTEIISSFNRDITFLLLKKNNSRIKTAATLEK